MFIAGCACIRQYLRLFGQIDNFGCCRLNTRLDKDDLRFRCQNVCTGAACGQLVNGNIARVRGKRIFAAVGKLPLAFGADFENPAVARAFCRDLRPAVILGLHGKSAV